MSRAELAKCDTCGTTAPVPVRALASGPDGWFRIFGPTKAGDYCSARCVGEAFRPAVDQTGPNARPGALA